MYTLLKDIKGFFMNEHDPRKQASPETESGNEEIAIQDVVAPELDQCRQEVNQWKERFMRMTADFENYKRRTEKEQSSWVRSSKMVVLRNMLPVVDTVELALLDCAKRERTADNEFLIAGIQMMGAEFHKFLQASDVVEIKEVTLFDPSLHEAIVQVETDQCPSGDIVAVLQKGYLFGKEQEVLRPAKVSVAK